MIEYTEQQVARSIVGRRGQNGPWEQCCWMPVRTIQNLAVVWI